MPRLMKGIPEKRKIEHVTVTRRPRECRELFANLSEYLDACLEPHTGEQMRVRVEECRV